MASDNTPPTASRKIYRWVLAAVAGVAGLGLVFAAITFLGSDLHELLTKMAGAVIGPIMDNQGVSFVVLGICVVGVWVFIAATSAIEWRRERAEQRAIEGRPTPVDSESA